MESAYIFKMLAGCGVIFVIGLVAALRERAAELAARPQAGDATSAK